MGPQDKGLTKRKTFLAEKYINLGAFRVSIPFYSNLWVWEPHEKEQKCGHPDFEGSWSHMFVTSVSGSNKSELCKTSNRNISNLGRILNQEEVVFEDPKNSKKPLQLTS